MFLGHFGVALAAKAVATRPALGTTVMAAQWADGLWPVFVLAGLEHVEIVVHRIERHRVAELRALTLA
jgi:hypothetical protein